MTTTISASGSSTTAWQPRREVGVSPGALSSRSSSLSSDAESVSPPPFTITWHVVQAQFPPQACSRWMPCPSSTSRIEPAFPSCWKGARAGSNSITRSGSPFSKMTRILATVGDVYCVGADLKSFIPIVTERADKLREGESKLPQEGSRYTMAHSLVAVLRDGATLPDGSEFTLYKPVIAAINGICAAGGLEMM